MNKYELKWQKYDGSSISDISQYVKDWIKKWPNGDVIIGCDSQEHPKYIKYSVTISMHMRDQYGMGRGGHVVFANVMDYSKHMKMDIYTKLWEEAVLSVKAAEELDIENHKVTIHLDYNSDKGKYSNVLYSGGMGYVKGMFPFGNIEVFGKPYSWAASHVADSICKNKQAKGS